MQAINRAAQNPRLVNDRLSRLRRKRSDFWRAYAEQYPGEVDIAEDHSHSNIYHTHGRRAGLPVPRRRQRGHLPGGAEPELRPRGSRG